MKKTRRAKQPAFRVGQRVSLRFPGGPMLAEIVEDRGNVGWRGEHIVSVRRVSEYEEERDTFEFPAEAVTPLD